MLSFGLRITQIKLWFPTVLASIVIAAPINSYAIEEVYVPGTRPGGDDRIGIYDLLK